MYKKITIRNRTDTIVPRIQITSLNMPNNALAFHEIVRQHLLKRHDTFSIEMTYSDAEKYTVNITTLPATLISLACAYRKPFVYNDFDYLRRSVKRIACQIVRRSRNVKLSYDIGYLTTILQEEQVNCFLKKLYFDMNAYAIPSQYLRAKFAYDYIVANVKYDKDFTNISAYDALIKKKAVCEGCAALLYRMLTMLSVPCRIITGYGTNESHAWNIISIDGTWYNSDVTWDLYKTASQRSFDLYDYFLIGERHFREHKRDAEFCTPEFVSKYRMANENYR